MNLDDKVLTEMPLARNLLCFHIEHLITHFRVPFTLGIIMTS
jgi:hypothetical protein